MYRILTSIPTTAVGEAQHGPPTGTHIYLFHLLKIADGGELDGRAVLDLETSGDIVDRDCRHQGSGRNRQGPSDVDFPIDYSLRELCHRMFYRSAALDAHGCSLPHASARVPMRSRFEHALLV